MATTSASELLIRQRLAALSRMVPGALQGDVRSVHQARVATRRLRAALPLVADGARRRKLERQVRRLTQALGPVRELDVALLTLDEIEAQSGAPASAIGCLREVIHDERQRLHQSMVKRVEGTDLDRLRRKTLKAVQSGGGTAAERRERRARHAAQAAQRAARRAQHLRASIASAAGIYLPDRLHEVRIAVKKLRYALEIAQGFGGGARAMARIRTLKKAQDLLGRMHDFEVLIARVRAVQSSAAATSLEISASLDEVVRRLEAECRQLHARYLGEHRGLVVVCDQVTAATSRRTRRRAA